jgi:hypothetical protein
MSKIDKKARVSTTVLMAGKMDEIQYNESGRARFSLKISREIIEALDKLRAEWGLRSRGAIVERILQEVLLANEEEQ